jgi:ParB-like chromosome segregation protein Spo0J
MNREAVITLGDRTFRLPYIDLLRPLSDQEYEALLSSITEHGIVNPVVVTEDGVVLDGYHRLRAAVELGLAPSSVPVVVVPFLDEQSRVAMAVALNANRRQLKDEDLKRVVLVLRQRMRLSFRRIAEITGVPKSTVALWCQEAGLDDVVETVIGRDGKEYPADYDDRWAERRKAIWQMAQGGASAEEIAQKLGIATRTVLADLARGQVVMTTAQRAQAVGEALEQGVLPPSRIARDSDVVGAFRRQAQRDAGQQGERPGTWEIFVGDPVQHLAALPPETVDCAIVDAASEETSRIVGSLCAQLARVVGEGGSVLILTTPARLPDVLNASLEHLRYRWLLVARMAGASAYGDIAGEYLPILWLSRGQAVVAEPLADVIDWRRQGWSYLVGKLTRPGMTVAVIGSSLPYADTLVHRHDRVFLFYVHDTAAADAVRTKLGGVR